MQSIRSLSTNAAARSRKLHAFRTRDTITAAMLPVSGEFVAFPDSCYVLFFKFIFLFLSS